MTVFIVHLNRSHFRKHSWCRSLIAFGFVGGTLRFL